MSENNVKKDTSENKSAVPGWGSAIGLMFLAWIISGMVCGIVSLIIVACVSAGLGLQPTQWSSTGGLLALVSGIVIGCLYHSGSIKSFGKGCGWAALIGVVLGFVAAFL